MGTVITCSPEENPEAYWATVGGMGLTSVILTATIRLRPIDTAYLDVHYQKTRYLDETLERFEKSRRSLLFLDHRVVEFCNRLAPRWKLCGLNEKNHVKTVFRGADRTVR
jgi:hypothetical protein